METKKKTTRGRPRKDFGELKEKINKEAAENKGKLGRGRPRKEKKIDDSISIKISNHNEDIKNLEKKNKEIHSNIKDVSKSDACLGDNQQEKFSRIILGVSVIFFVCAVVFTIISKLISPSLENNYDLSVAELSSNDGNDVNIQIGYNDQNGDFIEVENIGIEDGDINDEKLDNEVNNEYTDLIVSFYDKINNKDYSGLSNMADVYLKKSDSFKTYYSENWLSKFLDKLVGNKIYVGGFKELESTKSNVKKYGYVVKYKVKGNSELTREEREIAIVNRNEENLIGSIMCVTTGCSKMPFFQP